MDRRAWVAHVTSTHFAHTLGVAGTSGKSSTAAMIAHLCPTAHAVVGARVLGFSHPELGYHGGVVPTRSDLPTPPPPPPTTTTTTVTTSVVTPPPAVVVMEADEYGRMLLGLRPTVAIITSVGWDHVDIFASPEAVVDTFAAFSSQITPHGSLLLNIDAPGGRELLRRCGSDRDLGKVWTYGRSSDADLHLLSTEPSTSVASSRLGGMTSGSRGQTVRFAIRDPNLRAHTQVGGDISRHLSPVTVVEMYVPMVGIHHALNAVAAVGAAAALG